MSGSSQGIGRGIAIFAGPSRADVNDKLSARTAMKRRGDADLSLKARRRRPCDRCGHGRSGGGRAVWSDEAPERMNGIDIVRQPTPLQRRVT